MNITTNTNAGGSDDVPPRFKLDSVSKWLIHPHELAMSSLTGEDFPENEYKFITLQDLIDVTSNVTYYDSVCLFRVAYYMYCPEQDSRGRPWYGNAASSNNQQSKGSDIERLIWLIDVFGHTGQNMAVVLLNRDGENTFFKDCIKFRDSGHLGNLSKRFL